MSSVRYDNATNRQYKRNVRHALTDGIPTRTKNEADIIYEGKLTLKL